MADEAVDAGLDELGPGARVGERCQCPAQVSRAADRKGQARQDARRPADRGDRPDLADPRWTKPPAGRARQREQHHLDRTAGRRQPNSPGPEPATATMRPEQNGCPHPRAANGLRHDHPQAHRAALALTAALATPAIAGAAPAAPPVATAAETVNDTIEVMPLGDSITYGIGATPRDSYRTDLYDRLTRAGVRVDFVGSVQSGTGTDPDNEGHPGWTVSQISDRIDGWLATYRPDVILLHIGTNDMRSGATAPYAYMSLSMLLDQISADAPNAQVYVAKITGAGTQSNRPLWKRRIDRYNSRVPGVVAAKGINFHLVDQSSISGIDLSDLVHPNAFGFSKMAWNWYRALEPMLNTSDRAWPATDNPYLPAVAERCIHFSSGDIAKYALGCHTWYLRPTAAHSMARVWQTPVKITTKVTVRVPVKVRKRVKLNGTWVTKYVIKYVTRTANTTARRWITGY